MPLYSDYGMYYSGGGVGGYSVPPPAYSTSPYAPSYGQYSRISAPVAASVSSYTSPISTRSPYPVHSSRYSPMLSTITETPYSSAAISAAGRYSGISSLMRINSPKVNLHSSPKYTAPRPIRVNTADIDVSSARYKRSLPIITPTRINTSLPVAIASSRVRQQQQQQPLPEEVESRRSRSHTPPLEEPHFMPRCDENDGAAATQEKNRIKRDRTIVRISTVRQRSKGPSEMPEMASERGPPPNRSAAQLPPAVIVVDVSAINEQVNAKRTWRDNFGDDLLVRPKEAVKKTPGELLLERHLIKAQQKKDEQQEVQESIVDIVVRRKEEGKEEGAANKLRRPSFHDICQEISSDKIESVDDLNAGELRRRASLLPDDDNDDEKDLEGDDEREEEEEEDTVEVQQTNGHSLHSGGTHNNDLATATATAVNPSTQRPVNKITKSASGTLHCLLERHLHNNNSTATTTTNGDSASSRRKSVKRVHHKITAKVHIDEPVVVTQKKKKNFNNLRAQIENSPNDPVATPQLNAIVEHVSEHHYENHVVSLPGKKREVKQALPKTITRTNAKENNKEEDFWGTLGTRETIYLQNRKQNLQKRLQTCTEDVEEVLQFQEAVLCELPQSPTVEPKEGEKMPWASDVLKQVKGAALKTVAVKEKKKGPADDAKPRTKTTVAEKFERCENGLKIAPSATRDASGAKSPASSRSSGRVIDSSHEEVAVAGENRNKQTQPPVSSISSQVIATTATNATEKKVKKKTALTGKDGESVQEENTPSTAVVKKKKVVTKKVPIRSKKIIEEVVVEEVMATSASGGGSSLTSTTSQPPMPVKPPVAGKLMTTTECAQNGKSPSESSSGLGSGSASCQSSTTSTLSSVAAALSKAATTSAPRAAHRDSGHPSIPGSLSKFATIDQLNLLSSVDSDQPCPAEMAIEISVSRVQKTDPVATTASSATAPAAAAASATSSTSSASSCVSSVNATNSGDGMDKASPSSSTGAKKKRVVRKVVKRIRQSPAERSLSDVNIGIWSVMPHSKKGHEDSGGEEAAEGGHSNEHSGVVSESGEALADENAETAPKETIQELIRRVKGKDAKKKKASPTFDPQKCQKFSPDSKIRLFTVDEKATKTLWATPRPLQKQPKKKVEYSSDEESSEEQHSDNNAENTPADSSCTESEKEEEKEQQQQQQQRQEQQQEEPQNPPQPEELTLNLYGPKDERMSSTCSNDSGFEGGTAPSSPKNMLECDVNCHKKCEKLTANLCGVNQKLIVEALSSVRRGAHEPRDSPSTPPSHNPAFKIDSGHSETDELDTSYTYAQYQRSGRITAPATSIPRFRKYTVEDFHFLAVLGKGSFGKVLLAELRNTEYYYAVKCLKKDVVLEDDDVECTLIERKVLALGTKHPYLCHLFCTFQTESHLFFVMEYLNGGDLMFHIQTSGRFPESRARFYAAEIISGLKFLHKKGIVYRDLKLDNVLLDFDGHVRIADFGMCKLQIYLDRTADSFCGTPDYMAPEIIKGQKYNQTVDWWSFGVLLYEMLIGQSPFSGCDEDELFWSICNETPWIPGYLSKEATNIVKALLEKDATIRLGSALSPLGDIVDHRFFNTMNWQKLEHRELDPPFKPAVRHPLDTQYFDQTFTKERVRLTPIMREILHSMDQEQFQGFSYTNPNATLT